jgi:hypothetical protein
MREQLRRSPWPIHGDHALNPNKAIVRIHVEANRERYNDQDSMLGLRLASQAGVRGKVLVDAIGRYGDRLTVGRRGPQGGKLC